MVVLIAWVVVSLAVAVLTYFSRRKFSWLFLALSAGSILVKLWADEIQLATGVIGLQSTPVVSLASGAIALLIPVFVIMINGSSYYSRIVRILNALFFMLVFNLFLFSFWNELLPDDFQKTAVYSFIQQNFSLGISAGLIIALIELIFTKKPIE